MASNYTTNYQLNQWEAGDQVLRTEFNQDNLKIDTALAGLDSRAEELEAMAGGFGNCGIEQFTYVGTGTSGAEGPTQITFSAAPLLFIIRGDASLMVGSSLSNTATSVALDSIAHAAGLIECEVTWSGAKASLISTAYSNPVGFQMNSKGKTYWVVALYAKDV